MRSFINIILESQRWHARPRADGATDYEHYVERFNDVANTLRDEDDEDFDYVLSEQEFNETAQWIAQQVTQHPIYRGITAYLTALDGPHLGIYWSLSDMMARDFAQSGGCNSYDDRFDRVDMTTAHSIVITAMVDPQHVDMAESVLSDNTTSESEINIPAGRPVKVISVMVDGKPYDHPIVGQTRTT